MFRTVIVTNGEYLHMQDHWLVVEVGNESKRVPIEDIDCLVLDNVRINLTVPLLTALTESGAHVLICDGKHLPVSLLLPYNRHYKPLTVLRRQLDMSQAFKDLLWKEVCAIKIFNQSRCMHFCQAKLANVVRMEQLAREVDEGDSGNREGIAAKMFFRSMYGSQFVRDCDGGINHALDYGYAIIRACVAKTLAAYGYNCVLGIHHINESNNFNLADDLMEPLRPLVDYWVDSHHLELVDENLSRPIRMQLINLTNHYVNCADRRMKVSNAVDKYVSSFTTAIKNHDVSKLKFPLLRSDSVYAEVE